MTPKALTPPIIGDQYRRAFSCGWCGLPTDREAIPCPKCQRKGVALPSTTAQSIVRVCDEIKALLLAKNAAYGDSALDPVRCFSKADPIEQIRVRIDDKLSRLMRGAAAGEDVVLDLIGYLVLLRIAESESTKGFK
jgi:hypothetical protein